MALEEQWQEDIRRFGELAYLMWELSVQGCKNKLYVYDFKNDIVKKYIADTKHCVAIRKQSAALPFDLAAALAGDEVQAHTEGVWQDCGVIFDNDGNWTALGKGFWTSGGVEDYQFLRMKHPRRVGVDYSQIED